MRERKKERENRREREREKASERKKEGEIRDRIKKNKIAYVTCWPPATFPSFHSQL